MEAIVFLLTQGGGATIKLDTLLRRQTHFSVDKETDLDLMSHSKPM